MAKQRGDVKSSLDYAESATQNHIKKSGYNLPTNIICFKAHLHESFGQLKEATQEYEHAKQVAKGSDSYSRVGLANASYGASAMRRDNPQH